MHMRIKHTNNQPFPFAYVVTLDTAYSRLLSHHNAYLRVRSNKMLSNNNSKVFYRELLIALLCQGIHLFTVTTINIVNYQLSSKNAREMPGSRPDRFCKPGS